MAARKNMEKIPWRKTQVTTSEAPKRNKRGRGEAVVTEEWADGVRMTQIKTIAPEDQKYI